jgi:hypothetical protein
MITLELQESEAAMLREILESVLSDLRMEIAGTDRLDWRDSLRERKVLLEELIARLGAART